MQTITAFTSRHLWMMLLAAGILGIVGVYIYEKSTQSAEGATYAVVETVGRGSVSSGIAATGEIVAAQKLDLDVYKQLSRIDVVNVADGSHVEADQVLVSFDKSDAYVETEATKVALTEAELALQNERANATDPNAEARTLENNIAGFEKSIRDAEQDIKDAYQDFLNTDLEAAPHPSQKARLAGETKPTLSGRYVGTAEGQYTLEVYRSSSETGYSLRVSGLESTTATLYASKEIALGTLGLKVTFPVAFSNGDMWVVSVPNTGIATYAETKLAYEESVADLKEDIAGFKVGLANARQQLEDLRATDNTAHRDLAVEKAAQGVSSAREKLSQNYDVIKERDIVAPFSGTIQDMENVVVGATPTGGSEDPINLGTLISDEFLTTFTLNAANAAKVSVGQKVNVTVTSFSERPVLEGEIIEVSSLPSDEGVAQYEILARLNYDHSTATVKLREGMLADIEIVQEEKGDVVRIPLSALSYVDGKPTIKIIGTLTDAEKADVRRLGIIRTDSASLPVSTVPVELGIRGPYYAEVTNGVSEGAYLLTTATVAASEDNVVEQAGFGPRRFNNNTGGQRTNTTSGETQQGQGSGGGG